MVKDISMEKNIQAWYSPELKKTSVRRIAILPFASPPLTHKVVVDQHAACSFCAAPLASHKDFSIAGERLAVYLYQAIPPGYSYETIPMERVLSSFYLEHGRHDYFGNTAFIQDMGRKLGVDAVVAGEVLRVTEREGGSYSVVNPSSVSFRMTMFRVQDGSELYKVLFDETQRPLSEQPERIFQWSKLRFRWLTADELAKSGMNRVAATLPGVQMNGRR